MARNKNAPNVARKVSTKYVPCFVLDSCRFTNFQLRQIVEERGLPAGPVFHRKSPLLRVLIGARRVPCRSIFVGETACCRRRVSFSFNLPSFLPSFLQTSERRKWTFFFFSGAPLMVGGCDVNSSRGFAIVALPSLPPSSSRIPARNPRGFRQRARTLPFIGACTRGRVFTREAREARLGSASTSAISDLSVENKTTTTVVFRWWPTRFDACQPPISTAGI